MSHWAIPCNIWKTMQEEKEAKDKGQLTKKQQQHLSDFKTVTGPCEFTRQAALQAVMKLIATNNQLLKHQIHLYNEFTKHMKVLKKEITIRSSLFNASDSAEDLP
ncbi:hypothetical protein K443DRAFT_132801 [Laccaria amethystina LaAM-08-1]|uniref:Unplaced genomic scaffold K443scaffold_98, whole genome shotgun sequence n=1 Tax=Laccaria amethystina LaAM-08-1 TaxID=1095629 RepID=A0A0C9X4Z5_9AGAR|nr:hypothetical protein K443DRAFT_132801 [Laccaria amethystina LaAM-08-1]